MNKQAVMHSCHETQLSNRKEQTLDSHKTGMEKLDVVCSAQKDIPNDTEIQESVFHMV